MKKLLAFALLLAPLVTAPVANPISGISRFGYIAPLAWVIRRRRQQRARELRRWKRDDASGLILPDYKRVA